MHNNSTVITIAGARGTIPVSGADNLIYGGDTSCVLVRMGGESIILDGGTGLNEYSESLINSNQIHHLLISHPHIDHLLGIAACTAFFTKGMSFRIYAVKHSGFSAKEQVLRLVSPPLWPITPNEFLADVSFYDIALPRFYIGHVCVDVMEGNHPGGCSIFKLSFNGKSIVFNTDYEYGTACDDELISFAKDCDLFLCDGQYSDEEISSKRGFGHSSWNEAAELGKKCNAGHTIIVHHAPKRTDDELREAENMIKSKFNNCTFAHAKEEIIL